MHILRSFFRHLEECDQGRQVRYFLFLSDILSSNATPPADVDQHLWKKRRIKMVFQFMAFKRLELFWFNNDLLDIFSSSFLRIKCHSISSA